MNFFEKIIWFLTYETAEPRLYSPFHLIFVALFIISTLLLCVFFKDCSDKTFRRIALVCWIITVVFEIYKQICYVGYHRTENDGLIWDYWWSEFPFQFCSGTIYLLPFVAFLKDGKVRDAIIVFLATFSLFGGLVNMVYPVGTFNVIIGKSIQTMVHHGVQATFGIFALCYRRKNLNVKDLLRSFIVFAVMLGIAYAMNEIFHLLNDEYFNMFFISRHFHCPLALLGDIYKQVPYLVFLCIYVFGFMAIACAFYYIALGIYKLVLIIQSKFNENDRKQG